MQFKWSASPNPGGWYAKYTISVSVDGGNTWHEDTSIWSVHNMYHKALGSYHDNDSLVNQAIIHTRGVWNVQRRSRLDRERREAFNRLPPDMQEKVRRERREAWERRKELAAERKAEKTARIMNQMLELGPDLVRLKDEIDSVLALMAKGGLDRAFPYYHSRRRYLRTAKWTIEDFGRHINKAHKRNNKG